MAEPDSKKEVLEHWNKFSSRYLEDADALIQEKRDESAMLILCAFLDATSAYFTGRVSEKGVRNSFNSFVERYLPMFKNVSFGDLLFDSGEQVRNLTDMLYYCYRNGLIHEGDLPFGIKLARNTSGAFATNVCAVGTMDLDIVGMYSYISQASSSFADDLSTDVNLRKNYLQRLNYLNRSRFKKDPTKKKASGEHWRWCPQCGHELINEKCKLRCPRCHYFMSCSDFDFAN